VVDCISTIYGVNTCFCVEKRVKSDGLTSSVSPHFKWIFDFPSDAIRYQRLVNRIDLIKVVEQNKQTFIDDPKSASKNRPPRVEIQIQILARANIIVALLQESTVFAALSIGLEIETRFGALRIVGEELKRDDRENNALVVVRDEFTPTVLGG
jgi:hypothetical protein